MNRILTAPLTGAHRLIAILAGVGLIAAAAKLQVPFWPVPMTLQTLALMVVFALVGGRLALETVLAYLALGLAGLPVFAGPLAGPAYFTGPTAGFLAGFVVAALIVGWVVDRGAEKHPLHLLATFVAADMAVFALGFLWLAFVFVPPAGTTLGAAVAFEKAVLPFVAGDIVKLVIAALIVHGLRRRHS